MKVSMAIFALAKQLPTSATLPCNSSLLAQETLFLTPKSTFLPKVFRKLRKLQQILISQQIAYVRTYKVYVRIQSFWRAISATLWPSIQMFSLWVVILLQRCFLGICTVWEGSTIGFDSCPPSSQKVSSHIRCKWTPCIHSFLSIHWGNAINLKEK